jgi:hypothetical protein
VLFRKTDFYSLTESNWLAGSLSGPKSPIFRHTSQFFLTIALLWPAKNRFVWRKTGSFLAQTRPANQLQLKIIFAPVRKVSVFPASKKYVWNLLPR